MTPHQIQLVQQSFGLVDDESKAFARLFYTRLFEVDPSTKPLFPSDLSAQRTKLMAVLRVVVASLDRLGPLLPKIEELARRHVHYGISPRHYPSVGLALVWALEQSLGPAFTAEARAAWINAYGILSTTMIAAACGGAQAAA
jgi:hemoglobin-like flavoprotein